MGRPGVGANLDPVERLLPEKFDGVMLSGNNSAFRQHVNAHDLRLRGERMTQTGQRNEGNARAAVKQVA